MLLKKQTVWLLTMLSLVVVLSVYYITSPEQKGDQLTKVEEKKKTSETANGTKENKATGEQSDGVTVISENASDEQFEQLRLDIEAERSEEKERLTEIMASTDLPADQRNQAIEKVDELEKTEHKEQVLETLIISMGYDDALVRADGEEVRITVKSDKHSKAEANKILQQVKKELGHLQVAAVEFQPTK
ncbi:SpoIIIAH-like family protein [Bacillus massilinigeriensis]|uniref:SpoIIIAH-like family protein n=1 Tax=Bacillus massilionigeriensis TaxID=1805475 RepID=UPI00096B2DC7|nr:SpoIIIAH-like family protein [Bacillus massilionigeriensis]